MPTDPEKRRARLADLVIGTLSLIWGTTYFVIREGLADLPPLTAVSARFSLAAILFALLAPAIARREGGSRPGLKISAVLALCNFSFSYAIIYVCETRLPSGLVSVLWGTFPMMLAILSQRFLPSEKLGRGQWLGMLLGFVGVVLLFATDLEAVGDDGVAFGLLLLVSPALASVGQIYVKKHGTEVSSALLTRNALLIAAPMLLGAALAFEHDTTPVWSTTAIGSVLYLAVFGTVITFGLFFWALRHAPANRMGMIAYLTPIVALAVGVGFGDEPLEWHKVVGTLLVLGSVAMVMRLQKR